MPLYAKYIKDICTQKRQHQAPQTAFSVYKVEPLQQVNGTVNYKNPGKPTVLCEIGHQFKGWPYVITGTGLVCFLIVFIKSLALPSMTHIIDPLIQLMTL